MVSHAIALNSSVWTTGEKMPTPRTEFLADANGEKIYVIGGVDYSKNLHIDKLEIYDTKKNQWTTNAKPIPQTVDHGAAVAFDGKIYVAGGFIKGKVPTDKLFIYDTKKDEWQEGKPLTSPRGAMTAEFINGTLYVIGGLNSSQIPVNTVEAYDPGSNTWTTKTPMPTARHHLESAVIDGKLFALGGRILGNGVPSEDIDESLTNFNRNEMYDPQSDTWTVKQPMLNKRSGFAATSAKNNIYVFGGEGIKETLDSVEKYNPLIDKWTHQPSMPSKRMGLEAITVGNKIYTFGGQIFIPESGLVALATNEIFNLNNVFRLKDSNLKIETVTQGLKSSTDMAFLNSNEILVLEKNKGRVLKVVNGNISNNTVLSLNVNNVQERGLLGIAVQKDKEEDGREGERAPRYAFLFYTEARHNGNGSLSNTGSTSSNCDIQECGENQFSNRLYRYEYKDNKLVNPQLLIDIPIYWNNRVYPTTYSAIINGGSNWLHYPIREGIHQGGKIVMDSDNNVFIITGDGGGCFTHDGCYRSIKNGFLNTQTANKINGVNPTGMGGILYVTKDGKPISNKGTIGDSIPLRYYYAYGIRNSFGLDFGPVTGKLWDTENGPHYGDEINLVESGFNSGWAKIQGVWPVINYTDLYVNSTEKGYRYSSTADAHNKLEAFDGEGHYSDPEFTWNRTVGVTSIKFLDTNRLGKQYKNDIFVGDVIGRIYHFDLNEGRSGLKLSGSLSDKVANSDLELQDLIFAEGLGTITDLEVGPDGYLYVLSYSGKIVKILPKDSK